MDQIGPAVAAGDDLRARASGDEDVTPPPSSPVQAVTAWPVPGVRTVWAVDGLCGAGKTLQSVETVADAVIAGERFVIAGPTVRQSREYAAALRTALQKRKPIAAFWVVELNADSLWDPELETPPVGEAIRTELTRAPNGRGRAICITHSALVIMPRVTGTQGWHLLIDEAPVCIEPNQINLSSRLAARLRFRQHHDGTPRLYLDTEVIRRELGVAANERRSLIAAGDAEGANLIKDHFEKPLRGLLRKMASGNWRIAALRDNLDLDESSPDDAPRYRLNVPSGDEIVQVVLTAVLDWDAFLGIVESRWKSFTMMAANLRHTFAGITLAQQGFRFMPHPEIMLRLAYRDVHPNGAALTVLYASSKPMSKRRRDTDVDGKTFGDHVLAAVETEFAGHRFAWTANNDVPDDALSGERMPFVAHGINEFRDHSRIAVLSISNLSPQCAAAVEELGFTREQIKAALMVENVYQAAKRGVGRNASNTIPETVIVPDLDCAKHLERLHPGCRVAPLGNAEPVTKQTGRRKQHADATARKAAQREDDRARREASIEQFRAKLVNDIVGQPTLVVSCYASKNSKHPSSSTTYANYDGFVSSLRQHFETTTVARKEDNVLLLQAVLQDAVTPNAQGGTTARGYENIVSRSTMWLDIESLEHGASGPPIPPNTLIGLLGGPRMTVYSSFQHEASAPEKTRYRVIIPLSHAVGVSAYHALFDLVVAKVEQNGWCRWKAGDTRKTRFHGFDLTKRAASSLFYMPAKRLGFEQDAWMTEVDGKPLDVVEWLNGDLTRIMPVEELIARPHPLPEKAQITGPDCLAAEAKAASLVAGYLALGRGVQDSELNRLAWRLVGLGLDIAQVEALITNSAAQSHSPAERRAQVHRIMSRLRVRP